MSPRRTTISWLLCLGFAVAVGAESNPAAGAPDWTELRAQNRDLQQQVQNQQRQIDELRQRLDALSKSPVREAAPVAPAETAPVAEKTSNLASAREVRISGEVGLAFFDSGSNGPWPNSEFRVDDAKIFVEAPVWQNVYFYTGMELSTREAPDEYFHVGELYVDVEDVVSAGRHQNLNLRVGRFYSPFGEEYQYRGVMDDPLVTHSVADIWGIDEGVEVYGSIGSWQYNLAVQNGGNKTMHDYNSDKALVARLAVDATPQLHLSASAMRTGRLDTVNDDYSALWLANGFLRALGPESTTKTFAATLASVDAIWHWKTGRLGATAGWIRFDDSNPAADDARTLNHQSIEVMQQVTPRFFGAVRYGAIRSDRGYPLAGLASAGKYFFNPFAPLVTKLERFSVGVGYRFGPPLVWKLEYSWEDGRLVNGIKRTDEDLFASILGLSF